MPEVQSSAYFARFSLHKLCIARDCCGCRAGNADAACRMPVDAQQEVTAYGHLFPGQEADAISKLPEMLGESAKNGHKGGGAERSQAGQEGIRKGNRCCGSISPISQWPTDTLAGCRWKTTCPVSWRSLYPSIAGIPKRLGAISQLPWI